MNSSRDEVPTFTVSELNATVRFLLEDAFSWVWVEGEISNMRTPASGHWYFTLKDEGAQVRCVLFRSRMRYAPRHGVRDGAHIRALAQLSLFQERGEFQLIVNTLELAGAGALHRRFEALKTALAAEGLFAAERKRPLPTYPRHVGIVTSNSGAAVADIVRTLQRLAPSIEITLFAVAVQGEAAADEIVSAIHRAQRWLSATRRPLDVLIVGRGGGSLEDLWPFNEERVARAIATSNLPIVAAVGHETDFTIADFVADARAATPTAAAVLLAQPTAELKSTIARWRDRLQQAWLIPFRQRAQELRHLAGRLRHPQARLDELAQRLDDREQRLFAAWRGHQERLRHRVELMFRRLPPPIVQLQAKQDRLRHLRARLVTQQQRLLDQQTALTDRLAARLTPSMQIAITQRTSGLRERARALNAVSPLATLERGFSIAFKTSTTGVGQPVTSAQEVEAGEKLTLQFKDGQAECEVSARNTRHLGDEGID